jgi:hypothetical protein
MDAAVRALFERYAAAFECGLRGEVDLDEVASFYADEFIAASPRGVRAGRNDASLRGVMEQGYARYRALGLRAMQLLALRVAPIDALHCTAHTRWKSVFARAAGPDVEIDFDVHYLVQVLDGRSAKIFGWIAGDEEAELAEHGIG